jgi:hypothetical protein
VPDPAPDFAPLRPHQLCLVLNQLLVLETLFPLLWKYRYGDEEEQAELLAETETTEAEHSSVAQEEKQEGVKPTNAPSDDNAWSTDAEPGGEDDWSKPTAWGEHDDDNEQALGWDDLTESIASTKPKSFEYPDERSHINIDGVLMFLKQVRAHDWWFADMNIPKSLAYLVVCNFAQFTEVVKTRVHNFLSSCLPVSFFIACCRPFRRIFSLRC